MTTTSDQVAILTLELTKRNNLQINFVFVRMSSHEKDVIDYIGQALTSYFKY